MFVYIIKCGDKCKIGKARDPQQRLATLQTGSPERMEILGCIQCKSDKHAFQLEKLAHEAFRVNRRRGEWFTYSPIIQKFVSTIKSGAEAKDKAAKGHRRMDSAFWAAMASD